MTLNRVEPGENDDRSSGDDSPGSLDESAHPGDEFIGELVGAAPPEVDRDQAAWLLMAVQELHLHQASESSVVPSDEDFRVIQRHLGNDSKRELWEMAKSEQKHRHRTEEAPVRVAILSTVLQFAVAIAVVGAGVLAIILKQEKVAVAIFATAIVAVGVVTYRSRREEGGSNTATGKNDESDQ